MIIQKPIHWMQTWPLYCEIREDKIFYFVGMRFYLSDSAGERLDKFAVEMRQVQSDFRSGEIY